MSRRSKWDEKSRETIEAMAIAGIDEDKIAEVMGTTVAELRRHCLTELVVAPVMAHVEVAMAVRDVALNGQGVARITAAKLWLEARAGWKSAIEMMGKKELREIKSKIAERGTEWEQLLAN